MKKILFAAGIVITVMLQACSTHSANGNDVVNLSAKDFASAISKTTDATILDVRTAEEFASGHLDNARNIDWNADGFDANVSSLDKSKPVFVYCLSGGRSSAAAQKMHNLGFTNVYELEGGLMKWRAAGLTIGSDSGNMKKTSGLTPEQFSAMLNSNKPVLIDFYADWCGPCKLMKPSIEEIKNNMANKVEVISINADENPGLCEALKVDALPTLLLYKNKTEAWRNIGFIEKNKIVEHLN